MRFFTISDIYKHIFPMTIRDIIELHYIERLKPSKKFRALRAPQLHLAIVFTSSNYIARSTALVADQTYVN